MSDIFHEVDEEVRRDQLKKLWDRYSIYLIAAAVLIVAGIEKAVADYAADVRSRAFPGPEHVYPMKAKKP